MIILENFQYKDHYRSTKFKTYKNFLLNFIDIIWENFKFRTMYIK